MTFSELQKTLRNDSNIRNDWLRRVEDKDPKALASRKKIEARKGTTLVKKIGIDQNSRYIW